MASISSPGVGSGMDVTSMVNQLVALERRPLQKLQTQASDLKTQLSNFGRIQSMMAALRDAAAALSGNSIWTKASANTGGSTALAATVSDGAVPGQYAIKVLSLAAVQQTATRTALPLASSNLGEGTLSITLGSYTWDNSVPPLATGFTAGSAGAINVPIGPGEGSLSSIRDKINSANAGVTASLVNDASGTRLMIRSSSTGEAQAFTIGVTESGAPGLSALAYDARSPAVGMSGVQRAANSSATVNGLLVSGATNTLTGVIDQVNLQLSQVTPGEVNLSINRDNAAIQSAVKAFTDAYNALNTYLTDQTKYDAATKTSGPLQGDSAAVGVLNEMRRLVGATGGSSAVWTRLSDVGVELQKSGALQVNSTKLSAAMEKLSDLRQFFSQSSTTPGDSFTDGFALRWRSLADKLTGSNGPLAARTEGLNRRIAANTAEQDRLNGRVDRYQARLLAKYNELDRQMAAINTQGGTVTNFINGLNRS